MRLRLLDVMESDMPQSVGICAGDSAVVAQVVNKAQRRLVFAKEAGETGWYGSWATMAFSISQSAPHLTTPRGVSRLINISVCNNPIRIQNEFYEYLDFGIGPQPNACPSNCNYLESYSRNNVPTFIDLTPPNKKVRVRLTDPNDQGKRVFIGGLDNNSNRISSLDNGVLCQGAFLTLAIPFIDTQMEVSAIDSIQKDVTFGPVKFYQVDMVTGDEVLLLTMEAGEKTAWYRRYFINGLPKNCCDPATSSTTVQVTAMAKLELIDVKVPTDYLLLQGGGALEAICQEAQSIRHSQMDNTEAKKLSQEEHTQAIRLLQGQLVDQFGKNRPAIAFMNSERRSLQMANISMT